MVAELILQGLPDDFVLPLEGGEEMASFKNDLQESIAAANEGVLKSKVDILRMEVLVREQWRRVEVGEGQLVVNFEVRREVWVAMVEAVQAEV